MRAQSAGWQRGSGWQRGLGITCQVQCVKLRLKSPICLIAQGFEFGSLNSSESAQPLAHSGMRICPAEAVLLCKNN